MDFLKSSLLLSSVAALSLSAAKLPEVNHQKAWRPVKTKTAQQSVAAKPEMLNKTTITCGNKKVSLSADGKISISNASGEIAAIQMFKVYKAKSTGKVDWITFTSALCKVNKVGNKVVWELWKKNKFHTWKLADQSLEIMPDGLIKVEGKFNEPETDEIVARSKFGSFFITFPVAGNEGKKITFNDKEHRLAAKMKSISAWRGKRFDFTIFPDSPAECIGLKSGDIKEVTMFRVNKTFRITYTPHVGKTGSFYIDLRKSAKENIDTANTRAGVDFKRVENLELPCIGKRNVLVNSSFEQGFHNWKAFQGFYSPYWKGKWGFVPFELSKDAFHGKNSLLMRGRNYKQLDYRNLRGGINFTSSVFFLNPGKYTISFYAKKLSGKGRINAWIHNFHTRRISHYAPPNDDSYMTVFPNAKWKRYTKTINVEKATPTVLSVNVNGESLMLLDAIQVEQGTKATAYEAPAVAGTLLTSADDNFVSCRKKINARLRITSKPGVSGKVAYRVKNFFGETVRSGNSSFKAGKDGYATVALPFEKVGKGVFTVRFDYTLANGSKFFDQTRFAVAEFLNNTHRHKNIFSEDYSAPEAHYRFEKILERWRKVGIGSKTHVKYRNPEVWAKYREYGVEPLNAGMATMLWTPGTTRIGGFGVTDHIRENYNYTDSKYMLIKDHQLANNGEIDEAYLKKFSQAVEKSARANKHIKIWTLAGEFRAKFDNDWWSKDGTEAGAAKTHALYLKAFVDGIRRGNPEAKVFQDDPCNMRPDGGIAETARLLESCNKYGVKFDMLAIHPYRFSPESPDLDSDADLFFKTIAKYGYGKDVKVLWPEMMHWGPFNIPQWGTVSSTWGGVPRTWRGWTISYDIGATEKLSAAWYARSWLVALKYADRIVTATAGSTCNNFSLDENITPYSAQMVINTLGNVLGDCTFKKDIRFAPFIRAYVFEDAQKRPVAAVWCHMEKVDNGYNDSPIAEADFGSSLESVIDMMNSRRAFTKGKFKFPVSSFPLFLRGKKGTLNQMIKALEKAVVVSGDGISPVAVVANPHSAGTARVSFKNFLTSEFKGTFNGRKVTIPASGASHIDIPLAKPLSSTRIVSQKLDSTLKSASGQTYTYNLGFDGLIAKKVDDKATFKTINWSKLPVVKFTRNLHKKETSGDFRLGWNQFGMFIQVQVKDKKFVHTEYPRTHNRWNNDCLQIYFDTLANARTRLFHGYDEDDYDYAVFPNAKGNSSIVWRNRSVEQQLGLATAAPADMTVADDIPSSFTNKNGVLTYRVFFPAKYLLPAKMQPGWVMGIGLYAANRDGKKVTSALTIDAEGKGCYNRPHGYPAVLLAE